MDEGFKRDFLPWILAKVIYSGTSADKQMGQGKKGVVKQKDQAPLPKIRVCQSPCPHASVIALRGAVNMGRLQS